MLLIASSEIEGRVSDRASLGKDKLYVIVASIF
jgi:hypothetical protein